MIVYSHRVQQILKQSVVELGLTVVFSDRDSHVSLVNNAETFKQAASMLSVDCELIDEDGGAKMIFRRK